MAFIVDLNEDGPNWLSAVAAERRRKRQAALKASLKSKSRIRLLARHKRRKK